MTAIQDQTRLLHRLEKLQELFEGVGGEDSLLKKGQLKKFKARLVALTAEVDSCLETQAKLTEIAAAKTEPLTWQWGDKDEFYSWDDRSRFVKAKSADEAVTLGLPKFGAYFDTGDIVDARPVALSDYEIDEVEIKDPAEDEEEEEES